MGSTGEIGHLVLLFGPPGTWTSLDYFTIVFPGQPSASASGIALTELTAVIIISLLVAVVIHIQKKKGMTSEGMESNSFERDDIEVVSTFGAYLVNERIE